MKPQAAPPATPQAQAELKSSWLDALARPDIQAGLLQFALSALQTPSPGQSSIGHVANAAAKGGQAVNRVQAGDKADAETAAKLALEQRRVASVEASAQNEATRVGIEGTRAAEDMRSNQAREGIMREQTAATERQHKETLNAGLQEARARISADQQIAAGSRDDKLLGAILEDEMSKYLSVLRDNTQQRASINQNVMLTPEQRAAQLKALADPKPPKMQDLMGRFKVLRGVVNNKGQLADDNTISDRELVAALTSKDPVAQARGQSLLPYVSIAQQTRVNNLLQQQQRTQQTPAATAVSTPPTKPSAPQGLTVDGQ
jgi:hypothetical protein